jgi:hypothetical protein
MGLVLTSVREVSPYWQDAARQAIGDHVARIRASAVARRQRAPHTASAATTPTTRSSRPTTTRRRPTATAATRTPGWFLGAPGATATPRAHSSTPRPHPPREAPMSSTALDNLRLRTAHEQQAQRHAAAYRDLNRLLDQQDRLDQIPWHRRPSGRAGYLVVAIEQARQRIREVEAIAQVERAFNLPPILDDAEPERRPNSQPWRL